MKPNLTVEFVTLEIETKFTISIHVIKFKQNLQVDALFAALDFEIEFTGMMFVLLDFEIKHHENILI